MPSPFHYHTRHIPIEHLKLTTQTAHKVIKNGLTTCLDPDKISKLVDMGIDTIELRLVWWELDKKKNQFDWSRFERDLDRVVKAGLKVGLMAWFNHPPSWHKGVNFKCLRHGFETTTLSPWAPQTLDNFDRLYEIVSQRYANIVDFVYVTSCGDFGEPVLPQGVEHYTFSSPHSHGGLFWTGDEYAQKQWKTISDICMTDILTTQDRATILQYVNFIEESTAQFTADCYQTIRNHFPKSRYAVPLGFVEEANNGHSKSLVIKKMAEVSPDFTARWTGMAELRNFGKSNVPANRVSAAARFYGAKFGEEAALIIEAENAKNALYECIANGATMLHNDFMNITKSGDDNISLAKNITFCPPITNTALLWPDIDEKINAFMLDGTGQELLNFHQFINQAAEVRKHTNYDIVDSRMIQDGILNKYENLINLTPIPDELECYINVFKNQGGEVQTSPQYLTDWNGLYETNHANCVSTYNTKNQSIDISSVSSCHPIHGMT
ncbi:MAG TPA: hypothetical protein DER01_20400 [Phycisphaerales bacterium]|nr:hypothetical protein [Phycisphaerales bacterium]